MPISTFEYLNTFNNAMLRGFELYPRWVPLAVLKHFQGRFFCIPTRQQTCLIDWILWLCHVEVSCMGEGPFRWLIFVHLAPLMKQIRRSRGRLL